MKERAHGSALRRGRLSLPNQVYLVTTVTYRRRPLFLDLSLGRILVQAMIWQWRHHRVETLAYVIMPDHLHWLLVLPEGESLSRRVQVLKGYTSRCVNRHFRRQGRVWQPGFHDHALRREEDMRAVARYVVANPLRVGMVRHLGDYPLWDAKWL